MQNFTTIYTRILSPLINGIIAVALIIMNINLGNIPYSYYDATHFNCGIFDVPLMLPTFIICVLLLILYLLLSIFPTLDFAIGLSVFSKVLLILLIFSFLSIGECLAEFAIYWGVISFFIDYKVYAKK